MLKNKKILIGVIIAVSLCIIAIAAISAINNLIPDRSLKGNTISNIANGGQVAEDINDGTVYYCNNGIFAKKMNEEPCEITKENAQNLAICGDVIYFCNTSDNNRCYSIKKDGSELKKINDELSVEFLNIDNGRIYFACVKEIDKKGIYSMNLDGSDLKKICDEYAGSLILYKDYFYFINKAKDNSLYRIDKNGKGLRRITDSYTYCPVISQKDNRIYYSDTNGIYSCDLDGNFKKNISDEYANCLLITNGGELIAGSFDYSGKADTGVFRFEGDAKTKIRDDEVMWLCDGGGMLYFKSMTKGFEVMRCNYDGEEGAFIAGGEGGTMLS